MSTRFVYRFTWDPVKAAANFRKHGVGFDLAATVLRDPLALSRYDDRHGRSEERWVTIGTADGGRVLVVVHAVERADEHESVVRLISAREATRRERAQYESGLPTVQEPSPEPYQESAMP
jgi:uncharacterized DUF497 family protein